MARLISEWSPKSRLWGRILDVQKVAPELCWMNLMETVWSFMAGTRWKAQISWLIRTLFNVLWNDRPKKSICWIILVCPGQDGKMEPSTSGHSVVTLILGQQWQRIRPGSWRCRLCMILWPNTTTGQITTNVLPLISWSRMGYSKVSPWWMHRPVSLWLFVEKHCWLPLVEPVVYMGLPPIHRPWPVMARQCRYELVYHWKILSLSSFIPQG